MKWENALRAPRRTSQQPGQYCANKKCPASPWRVRRRWGKCEAEHTGTAVASWTSMLQRDITFSILSRRHAIDMKECSFMVKQGNAPSLRPEENNIAVEDK